MQRSSLIGPLANTNYAIDVGSSSTNPPSPTYRQTWGACQWFCLLLVTNYTAYTESLPSTSPIFPTMEDVKRFLSQASSLEGDHPSCAYYKYMDAVFAIMDLLSAESLQVDHGGLSSVAIERLFRIATQAIVQASNLLEHVIDLSEAEAEAAMQEGMSTVFSGDNRGPINLAMDGPVAPAAVQVDLHPPPIPAHLEEDHGLYGPEPLISQERALSELPLIPASSLAMAYCRRQFELQLLLQRLEQLRSASAKQRGNGIYLQTLKTLLSSIESSNKARMEYAVAVETAESSRILQIPAECLAKQITLIQTMLLKRIEPEELQIVDLNGDEAYRGSNLRDFLSFTKYLSHWCQYEVVRYASEHNRASTLQHLIKVAVKLREIANFDGMRALVDGLTTRSIRSQLPSTWQLIARHWINQLDLMEQLVSPAANYRFLRAEIIKQRAPCIPSLALLLHDRRLNQGVIKQSDLDHFLELKESAYDGMFAEQPIVQHYLLSQPFRWAEEIDAIARMRESHPKRPSQVIPDREPDAEYGDEAVEMVRRSLSHQYLEHRRRSTSQHASPSLSRSSNYFDDEMDDILSLR